MDRPALDVVALGSAIVDVLATSTDAEVEAHGLVKGTMALIDADQAETLYASLGPAVEMSGGAAANTVAGVASFGGRAAFIGKVRDDQLGRVFTHDIRAVGVEYTTAPAPDGPPTGRSLIMVTAHVWRPAPRHFELRNLPAGYEPADILVLDWIAAEALRARRNYLPL